MMTTTRLLSFFALTAIAIIRIFTFFKIHKTQPTPYVDEIHHIPQAQVFCKIKNFKWDPKITTLPGLYLTSASILVPLGKIFSVNLCKVFQLRLICFIFNFLNIYLIFKILSKLHSEINSDKLKFAAFIIGGLPVLFFTSCLYYTESGALFCVLLMYILHLNQQYILAALIGFVAIIFRQTNIVWVFFVATETVLLECEKFSGQKVNSFHSLMIFSKKIFIILKSPSKAISLFTKVLVSTFVYILVGISFLIFLFINNGIVVGDRTAHKVTFHFPQFCYFFAFVGVFAFPHLVSFMQVKNFFISLKNNVFLYLFFSVTLFLLIQNYTYVHPYVLADKRHMNFYVWKYIFDKYQHAKYIFIPFYLYIIQTCYSLCSKFKFSSKILFFLCVFLSTALQLLLDFRYFIIPFVLIRMNMSLWNSWKIFLEFCLSVVLNAFVIYLFFFKPFKWPNSNEIQRFMW